MICGCCTADLRPQEGITWPLIEKHLKPRAAEVESGQHAELHDLLCLNTHHPFTHAVGIIIQTRVNTNTRVSVTLYKETFWEDQK